MARRKLLLADLLCGAGGSTTGAERALRGLGFSPEEYEFVCVNHWPTAIETHSINHPKARHFVQDIATGRPHIMVPEGYLDLLMASPTCTHHSVARGGKPTSDQQRSDPWHIITWLTELRVKRILIENVWEFIGWGPVDVRTGRPVKSRRGEYFRAWIETIQRLGFDPQWHKLNAADFGDATTRQRFILMARSDGRRLIWPVPSHQQSVGNEPDLFASTRPWRPASEIIDWSIRGRSIFGRKRPLAPKTLMRIYAGAVKFGWPAVYLELLLAEIERSFLFMVAWSFGRRNSQEKGVSRAKRRKLVRDTVDRLRAFRAEPVTLGLKGKAAEPLVITLRRNAVGAPASKPIAAVSAQGRHVGVAEPVIVNMKGKSNASSSKVPLPTQTAHAPHLFAAEPIFINGRKGNEAKPVSAEPIPALDTKGGVWVAEPLLLSTHSSGAARPTSLPVPTLTTGGAAAADHPGCARPMLVEPFIATVAHGSEEGDATADSRRVHSLSEPLGAMHAGGGKFGVVEAFMLSQASGGSPRAVSNPMPAAPTAGAHALIAPYYGSGSGETCTSDQQPLPSPTTKARFSLLVPVTHGDDLNRARDPQTDGVPTITGANRGEFAFITAQHGERPEQPPRVHDLRSPVPAIAATGHVDLVEPGEHYDILFRMLEPHELAAAMGFITDEETYEFAGTKTDQIKQIGNAVSVRKLEACVAAIMADAAPELVGMKVAAE